MTHQVHAFEPPERFVAGTVGEPGDRTFFLQARGGGRVISVALEKVQVSLLAEKLEELLIEANKRFGVDLPDAPVLSGHDNEPLDTPVDEEFRVGTLGLAFDVDSGTVVIEAIEAGSTTIRWNWSRCRPSASARMALITSPWLQASQTASGPSVAFQARTAATARAWVWASPSPSGPGNTAAEGCCCTTLQSGSLTSSLIVRPVQSP